MVVSGKSFKHFVTGTPAQKIMLMRAQNVAAIARVACRIEWRANVLQTVIALDHKVTPILHEPNAPSPL